MEEQGRSEFCLTTCVLLSVHDNLLLLSESQCRGEYGIKINHHKKVLFRQPSWTIWILSRACKSTMQRERLCQYPFHTPQQPYWDFSFYLFALCCVTLSKVLNTFNQQFSHLYNGDNNSIYLKSYLRIKNIYILLVKCLIQALAKSALIVITAYE